MPSTRRKSKTAAAKAAEGVEKKEPTDEVVILEEIESVGAAGKPRMIPKEVGVTVGGLERWLGGFEI